MAGKTLDLLDLITPDNLGVQLTDTYVTWKNLRREKEGNWEELRSYLYATDTSKTSNNKLPWKNKTTLPKLCQIRDNLIANYEASIFPKRKWMNWEGASEDDHEKRQKILKYMNHITDTPEFRMMVRRMLLDYVDYGNVFCSVEWKDDRHESENYDQVGFVGPVPVRISPLDIVFNPIAPSFEEAPKIIRSMHSVGDLRGILEQISTHDDREEIEGMYEYLRGIRNHAHEYSGDINEKDEMFRVDGFGSFREYLGSQFVEVLTFYGDLYDSHNDEYLRNHQITVIDRHKVVGKKVHPSIFGRTPIYHTPWRIRQDNLWAMGPLENLVGLQYRLDHLENAKSDVLDFTAYPLKKIRGHVENFEWAPLEDVYVGDDGDVELLGPDVTVLQLNLELNEIERKMEEYAGAPKEALGIRTPGEKTAFEVGKLDTAASRVFRHRAVQFEENILEPLLNAMLELAKRKVDSQSVRVVDENFGTVLFETITRDDLSGVGRLKPIAARHFADRAERVQSLVTLFNTPIANDPDVLVHFSALRMAKVIEDMTDITDLSIVSPYVRISERADAERRMNIAQEETAIDATTPAEVDEDDFDENFVDLDEGPDVDVEEQISDTVV